MLRSNAQKIGPVMRLLSIEKVSLSHLLLKLLMRTAFENQILVKNKETRSKRHALIRTVQKMLGTDTKDLGGKSTKSKTKKHKTGKRKRNMNSKNN